MNVLYGDRDPREIPSYSIPEAAHYLRLPSATVRSWVLGRNYTTKHGTKPFDPLIRIEEKKAQPPLLTFTNIIELHVLRAIRTQHKIPMKSIRPAITYIEEELGYPHALARSKFYVDGLDLFIEVFDKFLNASKGGQVAIRKVMARYIKRIDWDDKGIATQLFPFTRVSEDEGPKLVVMNPRISFGRPVLVGTGVRTLAIAERYSAGESSLDLARDYGCEQLQIEEAVRYELAKAS
jgi:uncharacterized protein (DUF433 family)